MLGDCFVVVDEEGVVVGFGFGKSKLDGVDEVVYCDGVVDCGVVVDELGGIGLEFVGDVGDEMGVWVVDDIGVELDEFDWVGFVSVGE